MKDGVAQIAFIMPDMVLGGAEKALVSLLKGLENENIHISLLLFNKNGSLLSEVPSYVEVKELRGAGNLNMLREKVPGILYKIGAKQLFIGLKQLYHRFGSQVNQGRAEEHTYYDAVIAYKDGAATWYAAKNMHAGIKAAFIHTDFRNAGYNVNAEEKIYQKFDRIYCASCAARESFISMMPNLAPKTKVFVNLVNPKEIRLLSKKGITFEDGFEGLRILTVGRLSYEKGLDKAVKVLARLKANGYTVRWYVVGDGYEKDNLCKQAASFEVDNDFILMGKVDNPYGLMASCDIYVQPSNYEGYCIAVAEARALYRPIVACNFAGAREQLLDGKTGIITDMSADSLYSGVVRLVQDNVLRKQMIENLRLERFKENTQLDEFCEFITSMI